MSDSHAIDSGIKHFMDWLSLSAVITTLLGWLPTLGALLPIFWYSIRIYETATVQSLIQQIKGIKNGNDE